MDRPRPRPTSVGLRVVVALGLLCVAVVAGACSNSSGASRTRIVATTTVIGELVRSVAGDTVDVEVLIPPGADPHDFEPSAAQAARLRNAALIVADGLGLEERLGAAIDGARRDGVTVLELGPALEPVDVPGTDHPDPHVWLDPDRWARAAPLVADALATTTGGDRSGFDARAAAWSSDARAAGAEARRILDVIPPGDRLLVTNHDALEYFANRFGLKVIGVVVPGGSTLAEPSAADISRLAAVVRSSGVRAVFTENTTSARLMQMLAKEVGRDVAVIELATDTLGDEGSDTSTYAGLLTTLARRIADGLATGATP